MTSTGLLNAAITSKDRAMNLFTLYAIILLEGFVTVSVEILAIRQLAPVVGNNVISTSLIIGVFLLFLAFGYARGGQRNQKYREILLVNFSIAVILLGVGLSTGFIALFFRWVNTHISGGLLLPLTIYLLLVIAPIVYLLGQTVPITTNLFKMEKHIGQISGRVLFISTIGSFLGAVLTSLLLMNVVGVAWTVVCNAIALALLICFLSELSAEDLLRAGIVFVCLYFVYIVNVTVEHRAFVRTDAYADYAVITPFVDGDHRQGALFSINHAYSSFLDKNKKAFPYAELIKRVLFDQYHLKHKTILVLGAGGFTLSAERSNQNHFIYNDVNHALPAVVKKHFQKKINGDFVPGDARVLLKGHQNNYDVIISDVYNGQRAIPFHLVTQEHFLNLKNAIKPNGLAVINIIARPTFTDKYSKRMDNTIRSVFHHCMVIPVDYRDALTNIIYFCQKNGAQKVNDASDTVVYKDNKNQAAIDYRH